MTFDLTRAPQPHDAVVDDLLTPIRALTTAWTGLRDSAFLDHEFSADELAAIRAGLADGRSIQPDPSPFGDADITRATASDRRRSLLAAALVALLTATGTLALAFLTLPAVITTNLAAIFAIGAVAAGIALGFLTHQPILRRLRERSIRLARHRHDRRTRRLRMLRDHITTPSDDDMRPAVEPLTRLAGLAALPVWAHPTFVDRTRLANLGGEAIRVRHRAQHIAELRRRAATFHDDHIRREWADAADQATRSLQERARAYYALGVQLTALHRHLLMLDEWAQKGQLDTELRAHMAAAGADDTIDPHTVADNLRAYNADIAHRITDLRTQAANLGLLTLPAAPTDTHQPNTRHRRPHPQDPPE